MVGVKAFVDSHSIMGDDKLIDRHNCCIDSDIVERKAFFMEVICKLYFFNEETIPNISTLL